MNKFTGIGRIVNNLELRSTNNENSVCQFTIAINDGYGDKERTDFIDCVAWNKRAENLCKYCEKGTKVAIEGKLQTDTYEKDGKKIKTTKVSVDSIEFIEKIKNANNEENASNENLKRNDASKEESDPFKEFGDALELTDEDLPF